MLLKRQYMPNKGKDKCQKLLARIFSRGMGIGDGHFLMVCWATFVHHV